MFVDSYVVVVLIVKLHSESRLHLVWDAMQILTTQFLEYNGD